jgi:hypothetical protein
MGWTALVRFPAVSINYSLLRRVQTGSEAHPESYLMGIRGFSQGVKRPRRDADHSPPSSAEVKDYVYIHPLSHTSSWHSAYKLCFYLLVAVKNKNKF